MDPLPTAYWLLVHPCFCLCLGLLQMIRTTPLRRMILHRSQRTFTDARTFISPCAFSLPTTTRHRRRLPFLPPGDPPSRPIEGRQRHDDLIPRQEPPPSQPKPRRQVGNHPMPVAKLNLIQGVGKRIGHRSRNLGHIVGRHRVSGGAVS